MLKRTLKELKNTRGSAIVMAMMATVVLVVLALAIVTLSMGNLGVNQSDAMNNDAYYAADSGANSALEQLKIVVADYYNQMAVADPGDYDSLYNNFFDNIKDTVQEPGFFAEPAFNDGLTPEVTFNPPSVDTGTNTGEFSITSISTAPDGSKYQVNAKLKVKRLDVSQPSWTSFYDDQTSEFNDSAYLVGGTLTLNSGYGVYNGGDVIVSKLNNPKNQYYYVQPPGKFSVQSGVAQALNDCLVYPSYTDPVLTPTFTVTANNTELNGNTINPATGKKLFESKAVIVSNPGISFKIGWGCPAKDTVIYKKGSGTLTLACSNTLDKILTCYSDGDVVSSNGPVFANIYCRGNISTSGNFHGNIICGGNAGEACASFEGSLICKGSITCSGGLKGSFFAEGPISITNGNQGNNIIYSKTKITLGSGNYQSAVLFSGGDIDINGGSTLYGAIWAKGNVNQNQWLTLNYSKTTVQNILGSNQFFFSGGSSSSGGSSGGGTLPDEEIISDPKIIPIGRVN